MTVRGFSHPKMEALRLLCGNGWMQTLLMFNHILRWLKKPKVLRLVCIASSVLGLLCYALSSSFNHLLGNWSCLKMLLYTVLSFIISLAVMFALARSSSSSLRLEPHLAFLVLIMTSVYSFWFDNAVKDKPDAYNLISYAAFSTMSLGLSNLTQFGFHLSTIFLLWNSNGTTHEDQMVVSDCWRGFHLFPPPASRHKSGESSTPAPKGNVDSIS